MSQSSTAPSQLIPRCARTSAASFLATVLTFLLSLTPLAAPSQAHAQCQEGWRPFDPSTASLVDVDGTVQTTVIWDPDGPGPIPPRLIVAGLFDLAGTVFAKNIAAYDLQTGEWSPLGRGITTSPLSGSLGFVHALATLPNGDLIAAGEFPTAGGVPASNIARWNGSAWSPLGGGVSGTVFALTTLPNGDVVAGGDFHFAGGVRANSIARWDGAAWSPLGAGVDGFVFALTTLPNGSIAVGGAFTSAGDVTAINIAIWDGVAWSGLSTGVDIPRPEYGFVGALAVHPSGDLIATGYFTAAGEVPANSIARWNGSQWFPLGAGIQGVAVGYSYGALAVLPDGNIVVGGAFTRAGGAPALCAASWDGTNWSALNIGTASPLEPTASQAVSSLSVLPTGEIIAAGRFGATGGVQAKRVARWNGVAWAPLATQINNVVNATAVHPNGDLIVGGTFTAMAAVPANRIALWNGSEWSPLGTGVDGSGNPQLAPNIVALKVLPNGDVIAGGRFTTAGGVPASHIARWNGSGWSHLGTGTNDQVNAIVTLPNGDLIVGGAFTSAGGVAANRIARWDGVRWSPLGSGLNDSVNALALLPNGDLIVGGRFTTAGGSTANRIARWNGTSWSTLGSGMDKPVNALTTMANGDLMAAGEFKTAGGYFTSTPITPITANGIAIWNGSAWSSVGGGVTGSLIFPDPVNVYALHSLPNGNVIVGGTFRQTFWVLANNLAVWDGSDFSPLGAGTGGTVYTVASLPNGDIIAGGSFDTAGDFVAPNLARYTPAGSCQGCSLADIAGGFTGAANTRRPDGVVDGTDFVAFINSFAIADVSIDPLADIAGGSGTGTGNAPNPDGIIDGADFVAFINAFAVGC